MPSPPKSTSKSDSTSVVRGTKRAHDAKECEARKAPKKLKKGRGEAAFETDKDVRVLKRDEGDLTSSQSTDRAIASADRAASDTSPHHTGADYLLVHQVTCSSTRHPEHKTKLYADPPSLFAGDSGVTALHGLSEIQKDPFSKAFAQENPNIGFIVVRHYECGQYHDGMSARDAFRKLSMPATLAKELAKVVEEARVLFLEEDGPEAEIETEEIRIIGQQLRSAILNIHSSIPQYFHEEANLNFFTAPYLNIYHARSILTERIPGILPNSKEKDHAHCLLKYIQVSFQEVYDEADEQFASGEVSRRHFSKLFAPDDVVIRWTDGGPIGYVISALPIDRGTSIDIECWNWEFDGGFYKKQSKWSIRWPSRQGKISMASLAMLPLRFNKDLRNRLLDRGRKFWWCRKRRMVKCDVSTESFELGPASRATSSFRKMHPESIEDHTEKHITFDDTQDPPNDDLLLLLPPSIQGYGFHDKKWRTLSIEQVHDVSWSDDTFDRRLVLDTEKKEVIKALVTVHTSSSDKPQRLDIAEGKGKGLIILLHGGPGTGKTLTAESIAEYAKRPLYRVTCGDIGTDAEAVEKYLESVLYIGTLWQCVVLLDEADVFLEERRATDLQRNALVSVFLRALEYFQGILILTSNRVGTFDEAFKSRVQLAMHYPRLEKNDRLGIWSMFFQDLLENQEKLKYNELTDKLDVLKQHDLNGRQIRNVINTARHLARYKKEILAYSHLQQALCVTNEFEEYITRTRGHADEEFANAEGLR